MMIKHILMLIAFSVAAIFFQSELVGVLHFFMSIHNQIAKGLGMIFSFSTVGEVVQSVLSLLLIPVVLGVVFAVAHFFIKQQHFPHTLPVIWVCWAVLLASILSQTGHVTNQTADLKSPVPTSHEIANSAQTMAGSPSRDMAQQGGQSAMMGEHQS